MKEYKVLNITGAVLDKNQLEQYLEKIASDHVIKKSSDKCTYPIPRMKENFELITNVYYLLNEHIKLKIPIHSAGEWLLDNYYVIEETVKTIQKELTLKKYTEFLGIANGAYKGFSRVYVLAAEIIAYTDSKLNSQNLTDLLKAYQNKKTLSMDEIWNLGIFLDIAIIENIRKVCEKIYAAQMQKYRVENIIERFVENKTKEELNFKNLSTYHGRTKEYGEMKYPFIEYMSYRLKQYGKRAYAFQKILEEQVNKMGTDISDVIKKEHFDIAVKKVTIGNCITSIKLLQRISFIDIFEKINEVDEILKQDPTNVYDKMDYKTKIEYRNKIKEISKKTKISEVYIAKKCLELSEKEAKTIGIEDKRAHIGYYLIDDGEIKLLEILQNKKISKLSPTKKMKMYWCMSLIVSFILSVLVGIYLYYQTNNILISIIGIMLIYIPIKIIITQIIQYILGKVVKPSMIPKLDFQNGIPEEYSTFVVIPTILDSKDKVHEIFEKLEVYYLANQSDNIYFALLGDCTTSDKEKEEFDKEIEEEGIREANRLNDKYPDKSFAKFSFIYRSRQWNDKENCYLGWERKRGLLNQFNEYLLQNTKNIFKINTIEKYKEKGFKLPKIKYVITLDSDTELVLNTGRELIGAMSHILNRPILNKKGNKVIDGYGIMQPRVGINLRATRKSLFTRINAGLGGIDSYANAISDIYQDNFNEGIFAGKGIYDLKIFSKVLKNQIPEETVLSHDLLEGNYLRCGLVTDILLMDGYPTSYDSFRTRLHRWTRGDIQIVKWLNSKIRNCKGELIENPLNIISKYKILDNVIRALFPISILTSLVYILCIDMILNIKIWPFVNILFLAQLSSSIIQIINRVISRRDGETLQKTFTKRIDGIKGSIIRGILEIATIPDKAYLMLDAIIRTIYRMIVSKEHLLEWTTSEEAEKKSKNSLKSYYKNMLFNVIIGLITFFLLFIYENEIIKILLCLLSILWLIIPAIMYYISKPEKSKKEVEKLTIEEREYVLKVGKQTWDFFKEHLNEKSNFLPPDNYQENRNPKVVYRTSPTNIGLGLLSVVSSYDLKYENLQDTIDLLQKMLETILKLPKWNGHLYNWYDIKNLQPLSPKYVSTVDSGNFVGYLYVLRQFLEEILNKNKSEIDKNKIAEMIKQINKIIEKTNFKYLYSEENKIFSIGYNVEENSLTDSYYDLLASEARQASLVAIAKKDVPEKHWYHLSRTLTILNKYKGLISWSGTAFEYLMPNVNIFQEQGSLLDESMKFAIMSQIEYAKRLNIPWGISEAAFNLRDLNNNYQYKAFGVPWLGIKRGLADEMVVSAYGSILAIIHVPKKVVENLKELEKQGMYNKYGFYEAIDYTPNRLKKDEKYEVVKTYMAHHQGLILLSINNLFNDKVIQKRFMINPEIKAVSILLQERMPQNVIITKEKKEKVEKIKNIDYETYYQREYNKMDIKLNPINVISNDDYTIVTDQKGNGYSKYKNIYINRYKETDEEQQGIYFYLKNIKTKKIWTSSETNYLCNADRYSILYAPEKTQYTRQDGGIETTTKVFVLPNEPVEIRSIELKNNGNLKETIEITSMIEPILSNNQQDYAHKVFNNLFLSYEFLDDTSTIVVKRNHRKLGEKDIYLALNLYTKNETIGEMEYEIDKEKFVGRGNIGLPIAVEKELPLSKKVGLTTDPIVAIKQTVEIMPEKSIRFDLILAISEEKEGAIKLVEKYMNSEEIERNLELSKAKVQAETMYLGVKGKQLEVYQKMLGYLIKDNPLKILSIKGITCENAEVSNLWPYGISGDLPILLVKIKDAVDIYVVREVLKAYEYFRVKNIEIDLIILNEEKKTYDNYVAEEVQNAILDANMACLQNIKGGIFVLNNLSKDEKKIIQYRATLLIDASLGGIDRQLKDKEEEYIEKWKI